MDEKTMVNDALSMVNSSLAGYANIIAQTDNISLRQTLQQIRNNDETSQFDLAKIAEQKGYYVPATQATATEVSTVKSQFMQ